MEHPPARQERKNEQVLKPIPEKGSRVLLVKKSLVPGQQSGIKQGEELVGRLLTSLEVGAPVVLDNGSRTSTIRHLENSAESIRVTTETSVYELYKLFAGLEITSPIGSVSLPQDAQRAELKPGSAPEFKARSGEKIVKIKIDRDNLKEVLIQSRDAVVHLVGSRYVVLARIGQAHLPFYRSSKGTDGKNTGEWYPFFGHTGDWIIKGNIQPDGRMEYLPSISRVQRILNEHLILPDTGFLNKDLNITSDSKIMYSLGQEISMVDFLDSDEYRRSDGVEEGEREYIREITGYNPEALKNYHPNQKSRYPEKAELASKWMADILSGIEKAQSS